MYIDMHTLGGRVFFNIAAAAVFTVLTLLIYLNANSNIRYDVYTYLLGVLLIWLFAVSFGETILWETGTCNYLFTTTIVMTMVTLYRNGYKKCMAEGGEDKSKKIASCIGMFLLGVVSGWCNENTSGGLLLLMIIVVGI